jgi:16S rRNA (guanine527-N7)-methyltransferase
MLAEVGLNSLNSATYDFFANYLSLILRWNAKTNLTAVRDEEGILSRHFVESIACAQVLPAGIRSLLDFGSGAGFPGVPIALCRPEIEVTLAESHGKKAAFLQEVVRTLGLKAHVYPRRGETLKGPYDGVTLRAVEKMPEAAAAAANLVGPGGWLVLMTTVEDLGSQTASTLGQFEWQVASALPASKNRILAIGQRANHS